jgi:hypothetical protein
VLRLARLSNAVFQDPTLRRIAAPTLLAIITGLAWLLQRDTLESGLLAPVNWLEQYELFHIAAHCAIFGSIALLLGSGPGNSRALVWSYVLVGGTLLEVIQFIAGDEPLNIRIVAGSLFDLGIDVLGALGGFWVIACRQQRRHRLSCASSCRAARVSFRRRV